MMIIVITNIKDERDNPFMGISNISYGLGGKDRVWYIHIFLIFSSDNSIHKLNRLNTTYSISNLNNMTCSKRLKYKN